jgi:hypothetical protein
MKEIKTFWHEFMVISRKGLKIKHLAGPIWGDKVAS